MKAQRVETPTHTDATDRAATLTGSNRRTLEAIFRHPLAHNLEWSDVVALIGKIGDVEHKPNNEFVFTVDGEHHLMRQPHEKDIGATELMLVRQFLTKAGWSSANTAHAVAQPNPAATDVLVVIDHHEAKLYALDLSSQDTSMHSIKPYDPHHFLHHLAHKGQSREQGQRAAEDVHFYEQVAQALVSAGRIVVVGHGTGKSNAAEHLTTYLQTHDHDIATRVVGPLEADLSSTTPPQLLEMARLVLVKPGNGAAQKFQSRPTHIDPAN